MWLKTEIGSDIKQAIENSICSLDDPASLWLVHDSAFAAFCAMHDILVLAGGGQSDSDMGKRDTIEFQFQILNEICNDAGVQALPLVLREFARACGRVVSWTEIGVASRSGEEVRWFSSHHAAVLAVAQLVVEDASCDLFCEEIGRSGGTPTEPANEGDKLASSALDFMLSLIGDVRTHCNRTLAELSREYFTAIEWRKVSGYSNAVDKLLSKATTCRHVVHRASYLDTLPPLKRQKVAKAIEFLRTMNGPVSGKVIAGHLRINPTSFFTHYSKHLKQMGVKATADGYELPTDGA